ncbi:putative subtilisin [Xylaria telfairii]|nr:putative subtilisin [Xylaria telfairii]
MYQDIYVLLICWEKAIAEFANQREKLHEVLANLYGFEIELINIPSERPDRFLIDKINKAKDKYDKEGNLLIFYYGGHGVTEKGQLFLTRTSRRLESDDDLEWIEVQKPLLKRSKADFFIILDCCYAASAIELHHEVGNNAIDILLASGIEGKAPLRSNYSLTWKLSVALDKLHREPFRTWFLHRELVLYQKSTASFSQIEEVGEGYDAETGTTPILFQILSKPTRNREIILHQRGVRTATPRVDAATNTEHEPARDHLNAECIVQRVSPRTKYVNASTNTETRLSSTPFPVIQVLTETGQSRPQHPRTTGNLSISFLPYFNAPPRRSRRHKMQDETRESPETTMWLQRYHDWADVYGQYNMSNSFEHSQYKIAVLCTGVDIKNEYLRMHARRRKIVCSSFLDDHQSPATHDAHGWGTRIVYLLATMSPSATFYVAKVAEGAQVRESSIVAIEKAIRYAVHDWAVDMIIVPLGMREHHQGISAAILEARQHNITVVAPAGNSGGNERVAFPARLPSVIAVHATDGHGNPSTFNPSPVKARKNFSTLGELIPGIPVLDEPMDKTDSYMTGTSYAACMAAAILSVVIQFARRRLEMSKDDLQWLNSPEGAELLLELMSTERGGYDYVAPWLFFSGEIDERMARGSEAEFISTVKGQVVAAMRRMR